jgi:predicted transcriptional regulator of viral defense system
VLWDLSVVMTTPISRDSAITAIAVRQHGNVTRQQLGDQGLTLGAIRHLIGCGRLIRVHRGVYAVGRPPVTSLERACAAVLACGPRAALSHTSALTLWGIYKHWRFPLEVVVLGDRRPTGIRVHRARALHRADISIH